MSAEDKMDFLENPLQGVDFDLANNLYNDGVPSSLELMAINALAITLWQQYSVRNRIAHSTVFKRLTNNFKRFGIPETWKSSSEYFKLYWRHEICICKSYKFLCDCLIEEWWSPTLKIVLRKISCLLIPKYCKDRLEEAAEQIGKEILNYLHPRNLINLSYYCVDMLIPEKINMYLKNLCFTPAGTINYLKTALSLIDNTNLSVKEKYLIACNYSLKEKIVHYYKILEELNELAIVKEEYIKKDLKMMEYWTERIIFKYDDCDEEDELNIFFQPIGRYSIGKYEGSIWFIFNWVLERNLEVSFQYLWEKYKKEENDLIYKSLNVVNGYGSNSSHNIIFYLFSQIDGNEMEKLYKSNYVCEFLKTFKTDRRRYAYFAHTALFALQFVKKMYYWDSFRVVVFCRKEKLLHKEQFLHILNELSNHFRDAIYEYLYKIFELFLSELSAMDDISEAMNLLFMYGSIDEKKKVFNMLGMKLLSINGVDLEVWMKEIYSSEKVNLFKRKFFKAKYDEISDMIMKENYDHLDKFLNIFCIDKPISSFKAKLALEYTDGIKYKQLWILNEFKKHFSCVEERVNKVKIFLEWCYDGNKKKMNKCRNIFIQEGLHRRQKKSFFEKVSSCIDKDDWDKVKELLKSATFTDSEYLSFKRNLGTNTEIGTKVMMELIYRYDALDLHPALQSQGMDSALNFVEKFLSTKERRKLQNEMRKSKLLLDVIEELLQRYRDSSKAEGLWEWCLQKYLL